MTVTAWRYSWRRGSQLTVFSLALAASFLFWAQDASSTAGAPAMDAVHAEAIRGGYRLIDLGELRGRLEREPGRLLLVDTRQDWEHRTGHIPNSINFSFEPTWWARLKNRWALREALGADRTRPIVFY